MSYIFDINVQNAHQVKWINSYQRYDLVTDPWWQNPKRWDVRDYFLPQSGAYIGGMPRSGILSGDPSVPLTMLQDIREAYDPGPLGNGSRKKITGTTKDKNGTVVTGATVKLFQTANDPGGVVVKDQLLDETVSSLVDGTYTLYSPVGSAAYIVAYVAGSPDKSGVSANTLTAS